LNHPRFVDTNILVRAITGDDPIQSPAAAELFVRIGVGEIDAMISMTVIFETVFVLESTYRLDRQAIAHAVETIARAPGIQFRNDEARFVEGTVALYLAHPQLSFADCYHAALSLEFCSGEIYTYDRDFNRVAEVTRLEP
jgi:predicted nucleic acid-binding protein